MTDPSKPLHAELQPWSPSWTKDLVIYEIAPKAFTSPNGPESGTFESLRAKLPYLQQLGITGIWLAGHALADPHHAFNIWMGYSTIDPAKIDPTLGTPVEFKGMIDEAHQRGIKIFLDVTTHGLMPDSPIVDEHPEWFRGASYGMIDFDWTGGHPDLDDWWVDLWTNYVTEFGVDGFRLDCGFGGRRIDLWARIRRNANLAGHPIVLFEEPHSGVIPGVTDFTETDNLIFSTQNVKDARWGTEPKAIFANDIPGFYARKFGRCGWYGLEIEYATGEKVTGSTDGDASPLQVRLDGLDGDKVCYRFGDLTGIPGIYDVFGISPESWNVTNPKVMAADGIPNVRLSVTGLSDAPIRNITVSDDQGTCWALVASPDRTLGDEGYSARPLGAEYKAPLLHIFFSTLSYGSSITLSVHDIGCGRGFQADNLYTARGSRALFGYSFLFTPMIPILMSGEEFDAGFHTIPWMSPDFFGGRDQGQGKQLYGSMLDWSELNEPAHRDMLADVTRMLTIRKQEPDILTPEVRGDIEPNLVAVPYESQIEVPVPYLRWKGNTGIVVMANRNTTTAAHIRLRVPLDKLGTAGNNYRITDLWNGEEPRTLTSEELANQSFVVQMDRTSRGGVGLLKIEAIGE